MQNGETTPLVVNKDSDSHLGEEAASQLSINTGEDCPKGKGLYQITERVEMGDMAKLFCGRAWEIVFYIILGVRVLPPVLLCSLSSLSSLYLSPLSISLLSLSLFLFSSFYLPTLHINSARAIIRRATLCGRDVRDGSRVDECCV